MTTNDSNIPIVGSGATISYASDSYAYEVLEVSTDKKKCTIQLYEDKLPVGDSIYGEQNWILDESTLTGYKLDLVFRYGNWHRVSIVDGEKIYTKLPIRFGFKRRYYNPHF